MKKGIFISYRRNDTQGITGRIYDRLTQKFPKENIFLDVDNIKVGEDFVGVLGKTIDKCMVMLVVVGENWLSHNRNLDSSQDDFVFLEIRMALKKGLIIIPVLIDNAVMPDKKSLPEDIRELTRRQGLRIRHERFNQDFNGLERALKDAIRAPSLLDDSGHFEKIVFSPDRKHLAVVLDRGIKFSYIN